MKADIITGLCVVILVSLTLVFQGYLWAGLAWVMDATDAFNNRPRP